MGREGQELYRKANNLIQRTIHTPKNRPSGILLLAMAVRFIFMAARV
jgi:hypothetical protein